MPRPGTRRPAANRLAFPRARVRPPTTQPAPRPGSRTARHGRGRPPSRRRRPRPSRRPPPWPRATSTRPSAAARRRTGGDPAVQRAGAGRHGRRPSPSATRPAIPGRAPRPRAPSCLPSRCSTRTPAGTARTAPAEATSRSGRRPPGGPSSRTSSPTSRSTRGQGPRRPGPSRPAGATPPDLQPLGGARSSSRRSLPRRRSAARQTGGPESALRHPGCAGAGRRRHGRLLRLQVGERPVSPAAPTAAKEPPTTATPGRRQPRASTTPADPPHPILNSEITDPRKMSLSEAFPKKKIEADGAAFTKVKTDMTASCEKAASGPFADALREQKCSRIVRATYVDTKRRYAVTTGIAVLPTKEAAMRADKAKNLGRNVWFRGLPSRRARAANAWRSRAVTPRGWSGAATSSSATPRTPTATRPAPRRRHSARSAAPSATRPHRPWNAASPTRPLAGRLIDDRPGRARSLSRRRATASDDAPGYGSTTRADHRPACGRAGSRGRRAASSVPAGTHLFQAQAVRGRHVHPGVAYGPLQHLPRPLDGAPVTGRQQRADQRAPSSGRTRRRPRWRPAPPSPSRTQSSRCSRRIVVAPSRFLQKAAKSCSPSSARGGRVQRVQVQRPVVPEHLPPPQRIDAPAASLTR